MNGFRLMRIALSAAALAIAQTAAANWPQAPLVSVDAYDRIDGTALTVYVKDGRRYIVGKGEGCDIRVDGVYTSRRHGEIWLDQGTWWVSDAGSTR